MIGNLAASSIGLRAEFRFLQELLAKIEVLLHHLRCWAGLQPCKGFVVGIRIPNLRGRDPQ